MPFRLFSRLIDATPQPPDVYAASAAFRRCLSDHAIFAALRRFLLFCCATMLPLMPLPATFAYASPRLFTFRFTFRATIFQ